MFKGAALVKANIPTLLRGFSLKWYISKLVDFDCDTLNNNPGIKN